MIDRVANFHAIICCVVTKSALGWLANKGERWMPRLEKAMKDVA